MKKGTLKLLSAMLATAMLLTACGQSSGTTGSTDSASKGSSAAQSSVAEAISSEATDVETEYPEYLNVESAYPIIKDEYADKITLSAIIFLSADAGKWEDLWISKYLSEKYNINLDVEIINSGDVLSERKNLMFAANDVPDIMINCNFTTAELVKYGVEEDMLLQMDSYMNETLTPNILKYLVDDVKSVCTANDGHVYTLPSLVNISEFNYFSQARMYINNAWLKDLGLELPRTLDEYVDALYAIKEADPAGVGSENLYPMGSGMDSWWNTAWYLLNAFGYITYDPYGLSPALRDGEVVIPAYDMEVFKEYLSLMNQFYEDGIIAPTYFTMDTTEIKAYMNDGRTATYDDAPYLSGIDNWADFESCYPLTSEWQTEPEIGKPNAATIGGFVISADTEYPEVCMRLADAFFNNETDYCAAFYCGYGEDSEYSFGYLQKTYLPESNGFAVDTSKTPGNISDWNYLVQYLAGGTWNVGASQMPESIERLAAMQGFTDYKHKLATSGVNVWRESGAEHMLPYAVDSFPTILYASAELTQQITDLTTVIEPYAQEQIALFITGKRDLSETDDFAGELKSLGMDQLLEIYTEQYNEYINK